MDLNHYECEIIVRGRLAELRADAERRHRLAAATPASRPARGAIGRALARMLDRLHGTGKDLLPVSPNQPSR